MIDVPGRLTSSFRSSSDRFQDTSSYRKGRCRREANEYRDLGPGKYDGRSMMELQQARPKTMGSILGGSYGHRSPVARKGANWFPGRRDYPHLGPGVYYQGSRMFMSKNDAVMFLPGSRRGFHSFLNSGRSKRLMGDAARFETARRDGQHLGPGSYDLPSTLTNGRRPFTAPEPIARTNPPHIPARHQKTRRSSATAGVSGGSGDGYGGLKGGGHDHRGGPAVGPRGSQGGFALGATTSSSSTGCCADGGSNKGGLGGGNVVGFFLEEEEERAADIEAVRALPALR